ncbi:MAG: DNA-3-methyladenine glycosylase 2 family protein [Firmicutes bacterium]|nr:DNA-3-methyladenine glycosylase 2 family protein [Bacillota bacterium]
MTEKHFFSYGSTETDYLSARDPALKKAIATIGIIRRPVMPDLFQALVKSIVGQQISSQAQASIWKRLQTKFKPFTPETIAGVSAFQLQAAGITGRKAEYIQGIAEAVLRGELDFSKLEALSDQEVCVQLTKLKGVGNWTAEMFLIFAMQRPNVLSFGDLAIKRGLRILHGHRKITKQIFRRYQQLYSPYGSVASLYLWAIAAGALPGLSDPALEPKK